jgi:hypothetical protein
MSNRYKFFGEIALEKHFVSAEQLYEALTLQAKNRATGAIEKQLGQILLEMGYMNEEQISEVLDVLYPVGDDYDVESPEENDKVEAPAEE